jgi:hypothetical protein
MERAAQTFPTLTPAQIDRIAIVGRRCSTPVGEGSIFVHLLHRVLQEL